ncbi:hypothetical protein K491DRAFT_240833 [Lophiostoma macrostomum CBS 122681]|uniref:Uncharacterized protein n=1 Tax=Lophiostoma macrostomum CBS 122681 TaxID=1314788 RepID=A0A6A6SNK7_9PLEO|nr:hypothetical protein K491DRAFT_240833 [Lophiostoma macrostomum CBS 122681]
MSARTGTQTCGQDFAKLDGLRRVAIAILSKHHNDISYQASTSFVTHWFFSYSVLLVFIRSLLTEAKVLDHTAWHSCNGMTLQSIIGGHSALHVTPGFAVDYMSIRFPLTSERHTRLLWTWYLVHIRRSPTSAWWFAVNLTPVSQRTYERCPVGDGKSSRPRRVRYPLLLAPCTT